MEISARTLRGDNVGFSNVSSLTDGSVVDGREAEKKSIIQLSQLLLSVDCNKPHVTVMCVFGPDGIGKTTMAQLIYTHKRVRSAFNTRIFIGMFEEKFDEKRLMKAMIESLTHAPCDITESSILEDILKDELMGKRLLLVLDGAVNEKKSFWDNLLVLLNVVAKGSAVMVITSRKEVAAVSGAIHCYKLDYLSDGNCWFIFQQLAFNGTDPNAKPELVNIGKRLITKCERNILCIKLLGGLLSYFFTEEGWRSVLVLLESDLWDVDKSGRKMLPVLRVCYDFLPSHLKQCFAYSSLFPKGYIFSKNHLVCLWLSQDFIEPVPGREFEDIGLEYFEELCCRHFFHHVKDDYFTMHELIHDLAQYISRNRHFRSEGYVHIIPKDVHHFSLVPTEHQTVKCNPMIEEARDLQSFLVINRSNFQQDSSAISPVLNLEDLNDLFLKFSSLRTLDLSDTDIEELPDSFKLLRNMHYLNLSNTKIRSLPSAIDNLVNLHTLAAEDCCNLVELPKSIGSLFNLRYLNVSKPAGFVGMPAGIGKLTALRSLAAFYVGSDENHCGIKELKHLENLKGSLQISGLENVKTSEDAKEANLKSKCFLKTLSLYWSDNTVFIEDDADTKFHENILENLEPSSNLQELNIRNYVGCKFPSWIGDQFLPKLVSVIFDSCVNVLELPALGALPLLRYLSMQKLCGVETMEIAKFPSLEILNLWEMYDLKEWPEIKNGDFPRLRSLSINKCPMLKSIPCFSSLEELSDYHCPQLLKIPNLSSLKLLKIEGLQKIECLDLPQGLIALKKLEISHCGELVSLNGLQKLTSIEELKIIQCPKLDVGDWQPNISSTLAFEEEFYAHDEDTVCKYGDKRVYDDKEEDTIMHRERVCCLPSFSMVMPVNFQETMAEVPLDPFTGKVVQEEDVHHGPSRSPWSLDRQAEMQLISTKPEPSSYRLVFKNPLHIPIYYGSRIQDIDGSPLQIILVAAADSSVSSSSLPSAIIELVVLDGDFPSNDDWTSDDFNKAIVNAQAGERPLLIGDVNDVIMCNGYAVTGDLQFIYNPSLINNRHFRIGVRAVPGSCEGSLIKEAVTEKFIVRDKKMKGPLDIQVRLSAHEAIQFYNIPDKLGYGRPNYVLPDEEELSASMFDDLETQTEGEELEDYDVLRTRWLMERELEDYSDLNSSDLNSLDELTDLEFVQTGLSDLGFNNNSNANHFEIDGIVDGDLYPCGEHLSRILMVRNLNSNVEDSELKTIFEQYGTISTLYTAAKHRGFVMISYFDIRNARNAMRALQNKPLRGRKLDIHYCIPKDNPSNKNLNRGTLVIFNLDPSVSNDELRQIFETYGEVKEIRETPHKGHQKYIEFYDVRAAMVALTGLNKSEIAGKQIKLELSHPVSVRRKLLGGSPFGN